jgi:hypothetical protein
MYENVSIHGTAHRWRDHFQRSLSQELPPVEHDPWSHAEAALLSSSLAQFQLGESSDGLHLLRYAREMGERERDPWLAEAVALFIQEENRHSRWLGEFLKAQQAPLLQRHWIDQVFRAIRKPLGFGCMVAVLVCAEIIAVPYYESVRRATRSRWLRTICARILEDEAHHLRFQAGNLCRVYKESRVPLRRWLHDALLAAACVTVWIDHGKVLRAGGYTVWSLIARCKDLLNGVYAEALRSVESRARVSDSVCASR